jgi:hypothetical protein
MSEARALEELVAANKQSNQTMVDLVDHVQKETEARDRKVEVLEQNNAQTRLLLYMVGGAVAILILLAAFNAISISNARKNVDTTARIAMKVDATNQTLLDCLNSQGVCGQVNAAQQSQILDEVKKYNLVGFYCIRTNPALKDPKGEAFLKCMERLYPGGPTLSER